MTKTNPPAHGLLEIGHEVQIDRPGDKVQNGVALKYSVVEVEMVISNHQISPGQEPDQVLQLILRINPVFAGIRAEGASHRNSHLAEIRCSSDIIKTTLSFQIKVNGAGHISLNVMVPLGSINVPFPVVPVPIQETRER